MCYSTATVDLNEGCFDEQHQQGNKVVPSPPPETLWWQPKTFVYEKDWSGSAQNFALVKGGLRPLTSHQALQSTWSSGVGDFTVHVTVDKPGTLLFGLYPSNETFLATDPVKHFASMATESYWVGETSLVDPPEVDSSEPEGIPAIPNTIAPTRTNIPYSNSGGQSDYPGARYDFTYEGGAYQVTVDSEEQGNSPYDGSTSTWARGWHLFTQIKTSEGVGGGSTTDFAQYNSANYVTVPAHVKIKMPSQKVAVGGYLRESRNNHVSGFTIQGSNDDSTWTDLYTGTTIGTVTGVTFTFSNTVAYEYFRLRITALSSSNNNYFRLDEFNLHFAPQATPAAAWMPPRSTVYGGNGGGLSITAGTNKFCDVIHIENVHMPGMITTVGAFTLTVSMSARRDEGKFMSGTGFCRKGLCADDAATCVDGHAEIKSDLWTSYNDLKNSDSNHDSATDALKKAGNNPYQRTGDAVAGIYKTWAGAGYVNDLRQVTLANGDVITSTLCTDSSCNRAFDTRKSGDFNSEMLVYGAWSDCRTAAACNHRRLVYEIHGGQKVRVESFSLFMSNGADSMLRTGGCSTISVYYFDGAAFQPVSSAAMPCNLQTDPSVCGGNTICQTYTITMPVEGTTAIGFDFMPDTSRSEPNYALSEMTLQGREVVTRPTYTCNAPSSSTLVNVNASNETHIWRSVDKSKVVGTTELYMQRNFDTGERTILTRINNGISSFIEGGVKLDFDEWGDPWDPAMENNAQLTFACEHDVCTVQINGSPATGTDVNGGRMIVGGKISLKQNGVNASVASYSIGTMQLLESLPGKGHSVVVKHLKVEEGVKLSNAVLVPAAVSPPRLLFQSDMTVFGDSETFEHDVCPSSNFKTMVYYPIDDATSEEEYQTYVAPADGTIHITAVGAAGWMNPSKNSRGEYGAQGGKGGLTKGTLPVIKGQTFVVFVGGYNKGFGGLNKKGGGLVAVFEKDTFPDNLATDRDKGKVACVIVAGSGGSGGTERSTFENRAGGNGGGIEGWPPSNSMPQGNNMGCQNTYGKQTSGGGWFKGGSRGGAGWQSGSDCSSNGGSAGGSGYVRDDLLDTIMMGGKGARRYTEDLQSFSGDGVISIAFQSEFESSDTCDEFEQVLGAPTSASGCDVAHLQQLNFREYSKGAESGKSESLYICTVTIKNACLIILTCLTFYFYFFPHHSFFLRQFVFH